VTTGERVALHPTLESVLGEHFDDSAPDVGRFGVPLEVAVSDLEALVELVARQLIRREDAESLGVKFNDLGNICTDTFR
jgi:hypothetical protein